MDMGLRGTPWDSWLMDILLSLFRFFRLTGGSGCNSNASGMHHRATQVQTRRFRRSSCSSSLPLCSRLRQRVKELEEKSCEELWRAVFAEICVMFFSPFFLCAWVFPLSSCTSGQMCWRHCRQINRFHFRVLFRNLACSRQLYRPPTIFTGEGCVLAERISHHRTSRDSILLQNCRFRFCRVCSAFFDHLWYSWDFATFMPGDETTTTTTKKVVSEYAKPAWHEIVKPTAQKPILWVIVDRRSP